MGALWKNAEFRGLALKLLILFLVAALLLFTLCDIQFHWLQNRLVEQSAAVVGKAAASHPEIAGDVVSDVLRPASPEDVQRGRVLLAAYGYAESAPVSADPILSSLAQPVFLVAFCFLAIFAAAALFFIAGGYTAIYRKIRDFSLAAERVVDGEFSARFPSGGEGEFNILGHRFNQMANRLRLTLEQLRSEKTFLKNTISDISHQLKTPLASLVVYNDLMSSGTDMEAERRAGFLEMERMQLERLEWLIQSLLTMARLESGSIEFRREEVCLRRVAQNAVSMLSTAASEAGVSVEVREAHEGASFLGDGDWLTEAVINILKNAVEHSKPGGLVDITLDQTPLTASVLVADHGEGIGPGDLPHVFERFYRGSQRVKPNSIGIGLALSKAIVEGQGGSISVRSEPGKGSEFTISFLKNLGE